MKINEFADKMKLPSINIGDEIRVGKFKNRKAEITGFDKDEHNQPVLKTTKGDQKLFKPRISKLMNKDESVNEGYKLQLERDADMMVLNITDTATGKRTEVRGKSGYETGNHDPNDKLHQLLDKVGKSANIAELINGEVVSINPKHPDAKSAKAATDIAYNENFADGKVKGKSRPGRVKRSGASCNGSVTELRAKAKKASGEKAKMYHWCANMKSGKKK
jgi:hypothetical protein